ncbi:MAG: hypothetical protein H6672_03320 [Anaerolineaceae bacterium]|nr:hypothetical protein [Anaerolineaceae bacterium]
MTRLTRRDIILLSIIVLLALGARLLPSPRTIDDAFITFRYSRNIVAGEGFVYNPGVHTLGTTTPLFTLVMAGISGLTGGSDFPWYALSVNTLADMVTAALLYLLALRLTGSRWWGTLLGLLWALSPMSVTFAVGGMETSVAVLWMVAATVAFVTDRPILLGVFAALGFLTRIDSVLWSGLLLLFQLVEGFLPGSAQYIGITGRGMIYHAPTDTANETTTPVRAHGGASLQPASLSAKLGILPWRTWAVGLVVVLPWMVFAWAYFGSPVPNSLSAKSVAYIMPPGSAFARLLQFYVQPFSEYTLFGAPGALVGLVVYFALIIVGTMYIGKHKRRLLPLVVYPWVYLAVFSVANPLIFRWYLLPPMPGLMIGILAGLWALVAAIQKPRPAWQWLAPGVAVALALLWGASSLSGWVLQPDHGPDRPAPEMAWHQLELYYEQLGRRLHDEFGTDFTTRVASADIGAVGYFSGATIIDPVGLITPEMRRYYPLDPALIVAGQNYAIPPQSIQDTQPDYIITMEAFVRLGLEKEAWFNDAYTLVEEIPTDFYGTGVRLYARR